MCVCVCVCERRAICYPNTWMSGGGEKTLNHLSIQRKICQPSFRREPCQSEALVVLDVTVFISSLPFQ